MQVFNYLSVTFAFEITSNHACLSRVSSSKLCIVYQARHNHIQHLIKHCIKMDDSFQSLLRDLYDEPVSLVATDGENERFPCIISNTSKNVSADTQTLRSGLRKRDEA